MTDILEAEPVVWTSHGLGSYTIKAAPEDVPRGTRIEIHLKEGEERFARPDTVNDTIRKYSNFVPFPVSVNGEQKNKTTAVWREQPTQVTDEQYADFFQYLTFSSEEPRLRLHFSTDSPIQFSALLFVPPSDPEVLGFGEGEVSVPMIFLEFPHLMTLARN